MKTRSYPHRVRRRGARGFTLIELMVTIAIAAILMMVAVPSVTAFQRNAELTSTTNSLLAAINAARGEALKRGMNAMVVPAVGTNWNSGIIAFVDTDRSQSYSGSDITILTTSALPSYFTVDAAGSNTQTVLSSAPYIMFNPSGYAVTKGGTVGVAGASSLQIYRNDLTSTLQWEQTRRLMVAATGRVRTCKPVSATDTKCQMSTPS